MTNDRLTYEQWVAIAQASPEAGSGDCARVISRRDGRTLFFVGDVAGHDARAASFAAELNARVSELAHWSSPGALLVALNAAVEASWPSDVFVSAICLLLDPRTGHGTIAVAGQVAPIVRGASCCRTLEVNAGAALGLFAEQAYPELRFSLGADDVLVAVTDGVTDRFATGSDHLGIATLARLLDDGPAHPTEVCDSLLRATRGFGQHDDATVLAIAPALHGIASPLVSAPEEISLAA